MKNFDASLLWMAPVSLEIEFMKFNIVWNKKKKASVVNDYINANEKKKGSDTPTEIYLSVKTNPAFFKLLLNSFFYYLVTISKTIKQACEQDGSDLPMAKNLSYS